MKVLRLLLRFMVVLFQEGLKLWQKYRAYRALKAQQQEEKVTIEPSSEETQTVAAHEISATTSPVTPVEDNSQSATIAKAEISLNPVDPASAAELEESVDAPIRPQQAKIPLVEAETQSTPSLQEMQWTSPGTGVTVQNILIADGFIYMGQQSDPAERHPYLIDPSLKLKNPTPQKRQDILGMDWSHEGRLSYATFSPEMRSVFLGWLATGRKERDLPKSALQLFLFGIEARVVSLLSGDRTVDELLALILELERLEVQYAHHSSLVPQIKQLTECCQIQLALSCQPETLLALLPVSQKLSMALKVVLGRCIEQSKTIPMALLWAWYMSSSVAVDLKTPAKRCERAFNFLIQTRGELRDFAITVGETPSMLPVVYQPFGPSFGPEPAPISILDTIDITDLEPQLTILEALIEDCTNDLDAYSRLIGRSPELEGTPAAVALLPQELVFLSGNAQVSSIQTWCQQTLEEQRFVSLPGETLLEQWPTATEGKIRKKEAELLGQFLAKFGFGYVPDVRYWQATFNPKHLVMLFRLDQLGVEAPSEDYPAALMLLELAPFLEIVPPESLEDILVEKFDITASERSRLTAVQQWRRDRPLTWKQTCNRIKKLSQDEQFKLAVTLTQQLEQDWRLDETRYLELQALIPLPEREVPTEEAIAANSEISADISPPDTTESDVSGDVISPTPEEDAPNEPTPETETPSAPVFTLDTQLIAQRNQESQVASGLLSEIFEEDEPSPEKISLEATTENAEPGDISEPSNSTSLTLGLDPSHWSLLEQIGQKESWERAELEAIAQDQGLLLDGALENINDVAFDQCDEALTEGDDPIEVNDWVFEELQAA